MSHRDARRVFEARRAHLELTPSYYRRARNTAATLLTAENLLSVSRYSVDYNAAVAAHWRMILDSQYLRV